MGGGAGGKSPCSFCRSTSARDNRTRILANLFYRESTVPVAGRGQSLVPHPRRFRLDVWLQVARRRRMEFRKPARLRLVRLGLESQPYAAIRRVVRALKLMRPTIGLARNQVRWARAKRCRVEAKKFRRARVLPVRPRLPRQGRSCQGAQSVRALVKQIQEGRWGLIRRAGKIPPPRFPRANPVHRVRGPQSVWWCRFRTYEIK